MIESKEKGLEIMKRLIGIANRTYKAFEFNQQVLKELYTVLEYRRMGVELLDEHKDLEANQAVYLAIETIMKNILGSELDEADTVIQKMDEGSIKDLVEAIYTDKKAPVKAEVSVKTDFAPNLENEIETENPTCVSPVDNIPDADEFCQILPENEMIVNEDTETNQSGVRVPYSWKSNYQTGNIKKQSKKNYYKKRNYQKKQSCEREDFVKKNTEEYS